MGRHSKLASFQFINGGNLAIKTQPGSVCDEIYRKAEPYLDTRRNDVHVSLSYDFARRLLAHYPKANEEIVLPAIITRPEALSLNDQLVKDADKLWRFTPTGVGIDHTRFGIPRDSYMKWLDTVIDDWLFTPLAREMAHAALTEAKCTLES